MVMVGIQADQILRRLLLALLLLSTNSHCRAPGVEDTDLPDDHRLYHALHHFEVLHRDHIQHSVRENSRHIHLKTLGREFQLLLRPKQDPLRVGLTATVVGERGIQEVVDVNPDHFLTGVLADDPHSLVHAHYDHNEGLLSASIVTPSDHYYVEPSHRHFSQSHDFHMISYRASDLKYNLTNDPNQHFCGANHKPHPVTGSHTPSAQHHDSMLTLGKTSQHQWTEHTSLNRLKRQTPTNQQTLCPLELVATYNFHQRFSNNDNIRNSIQFIVTVVDMADDQIFRISEWSEDIVGERGLSISNITIYTTPTSNPAYNSARPGGWFSEDLLRVFSNNDWGHVCLAHLFTAEAFTDNRLGVAYIASSGMNTIGGICSRVLQNFNNQPVNTANVGVSSFLRDGRPLLLAEAKLVFAHELGHNWGSEHDPTGVEGSLCNPSLNAGGKFLMFPAVTDGQQENNNRFSSCSRQAISDVIRAKSTQCFIENMPSNCGNYAVDEGEQCDAGFDGVIGLDPCCDSSCQLRPSAVCSDVNEECCSQCRFADNSTVCEPPNSAACLQGVMCSGLGPSCPTAQPYIDVGTPCRGSGLCLPVDTQCNNSLPCVPEPVSSIFDTLTCFDLCEQQNRTQCFCDPFTANECRLCCRANDENGTCLPLDSGELLVDGSTCVGGVCREGVCEAATQDLASRLFDLITNINSDAFLVFMQENIVGTVLFFVTVLWIPVSVAITLYDKKVWRRFREEADKKEKELCRQNNEDIEDLLNVDVFASDAEIDASHAKIGLQRQASITESIYDGSFTYDGAYFLSAHGYTSPTKYKDEHGRKLSAIFEASAELNPETDNIHAHMRGGGVEGQTEATDFHVLGTLEEGDIEKDSEKGNDLSSSWTVL